MGIENRSVPFVLSALWVGVSVLCFWLLADAITDGRYTSSSLLDVVIIGVAIVTSTAVGLVGALFGYVGIKECFCQS